jgi:hypothetical protein
LRVVLELRFAWWLDWYISALTAVAVITQREPDWDKLAAVIGHAVRFKVVETEQA